MTEGWYTLASWRVTPGREQEFVQAWKGRLADAMLKVPHGSAQGTLLQSTDDAQQFYSFGPWESLEAIKVMRSDQGAQEAIQHLRSLCDEAKTGAYVVVATAQ